MGTIGFFGAVRHPVHSEVFKIAAYTGGVGVVLGGLGGWGVGALVPDYSLDHPGALSAAALVGAGAGVFIPMTATADIWGELDRMKGRGRGAVITAALGALLAGPAVGIAAALLTTGNRRASA